MGIGSGAQTAGLSRVAAGAPGRWAGLAALGVLLAGCGGGGNSLGRAESCQALRAAASQNAVFNSASDRATLEALGRTKEDPSLTGIKRELVRAYEMSAQANSASSGGHTEIIDKLNAANTAVSEALRRLDAACSNTAR